MANPTGNKRNFIIIAIIALLFLCCCGFFALGGLAYLGFAEDAGESSTLPADPAVPDNPAVSGEAPGTDGVEAPDDDIWGEASRLVEEFYPDYELIDLQEAGTDGTWTTFHLMAAATSGAPITIGTVARRYGTGSGDGAPQGGDYIDAHTAAQWAHDKVESGVYGFASPSGLFPGAPVLDEFAAARPGYIVVDFSIWNQMDVTFHLITEEQWGEWDGVSAFNTSDWTWDLRAGTWSETAFE